MLPPGYDPQWRREFSEHQTLAQRRCNVGPASQTMANITPTLCQRIVFAGIRYNNIAISSVQQHVIKTHTEVPGKSNAPLDW